MSQLPIGSDFVQCLAGRQNRLYAFIFTLLGNADQAEDVLQETNRVIWENASDFEPGSNFTAWAFQIAFNQVRTHRKRVQRDRLSFDDRALDALANEVAEHQVEMDERQQALALCLDKLQPQHERMIQQRYRQGLSIKKIAAGFKRSASSVSVTLFRLRIKLLECIEEAMAS